MPALVFILVALIAFAAALALRHAADLRDQDRLENEWQRAATAFVDRIETHHALLRGGAGLFAASSEVRREDFEAYVERLGIGLRYPGVLAVAYSERAVGEAERRALVQRMRGQGFADFRVWPETPRARYHSILYLSPFDRRNQAAVGYDMFTEPVRRAAMARARDLGEPVASGRVLLVQEIDSVKQPGFLIYTPVFEGGGVPPTLDARRRLLRGFVYSPLRAHDFLGSVYQDEADRLVDVAIHAGAPSPESLLYRTDGAAESGERTISRPVDVSGRTWTVSVTATDAFGAESTGDYAGWILGLGFVVGLVLAAAAAATDRARRQLRAVNASLEERVEARTAELLAANETLTGEMRRRAEAEDQLRQMQKMEAIGQLTGGIAHDFNNMLAVVIGSLDMAKRRASDPARVGRLIDTALEGATRAATLTQRLLAFSRRQPLQPEAIDPNKLVLSMSELLRRTLGETIALETVLAGGLWRTFADASQLENAILNLAVNARDAIHAGGDGGGALTIETANCDLDERYVRSRPEVSPGQYVLVAVSDTGQGMSSETIARAIEPFFTTKEVGKGTGLGLSQVFGFVKQSGGHLGIYSEQGQGSTLKIYLPRYIGPDQPLEQLTEPLAAPEGRPDELILVVEDEEQVRLMSVASLRDLGYTVLHAPDGRTALDTLEAHPGVRLLFSDVVMPGMNGRQLAQEVHARWPEMKVLFTTGYTRNAVVHNGVLGPGVAFLPKPFTIDQLAAKIRSVLDA